MRYPDDPPGFPTQACGLFCRHARPGHGRNSRLRRLLYDSRRYSGHHLAHARRAADLRCRHRSDLRPERRHGSWTVPRHPQSNPTPLLVISGYIYSSRRGSEPAFSHRRYETPVSGVDARCRRFAENFTFMEAQGGVWGARRDVIMRATAALNEFVESAAALGLVNGKAQVEVSFDEFNLDMDIRYNGELM